MKAGAVIRRARERAGMTLRELGEKVGMSASQLSVIETGQVENPVSPEKMVLISDAVLDRQMLVEFCDGCPIRKRIVIHKFPPLNKIRPGAEIALLKVGRKMAEASDALQPMLEKILNANHQQDPDFRDFRNRAFVLILDLERGLEIVKQQALEQGLITNDELQILRDVQQRLCIEKGHHEPEQEA